MHVSSPTGGVSRCCEFFYFQFNSVILGEYKPPEPRVLYLSVTEATQERKLRENQEENQEENQAGSFQEHLC